jgi:AraC-like DNA-binding protein
VSAALRQLGLHFTSLELGMVDITEDISPELRDQIRPDLLASGLELLDDSKNVLIERIKNIIIELVHYSDEPLPINLSVHLTRLLHHNYTYMANIFSDVQGYTIEKFLIEHKIERVKELIVYNERTLTQIAFKMSYSSVAHLSAQFKKITGHTASDYKHLEVQRRSMLEEIGADA